MPGFDVQGARQSGYSDDEILQHLTHTRKFDVQGAIKAGYKKSEVIDYLANSTAKESQPVTQTVQQGDQITQDEGGNDVVYRPSTGERFPLNQKQNIQQQGQRTWLDSATDAAREFWRQINPVAGAEGTAQALSHPIQTLAADNSARQAVLKKAEDYFKKGDYGAGVAHALYSIIPLLGPELSRSGEQFQQGEYAKGVGSSLGMGVALAGPKEIIPAAGKTATAIRNAAGRVGESVAPRLAETAMGIQTRDRLHGRTPGATALRETTANNPGELAVQSQDRAAALTKELEIAADSSEMPASVDQAVAMLNEEAKRAAKENNPQLLSQINQLKNRMTIDLNGQPFQNPTTPGQILALKRGIDDLIASWGPRERTAPIEGVRHQLYGILQNELENKVPEAKGLNQKIGDLITVAKRAELKAAGPDMKQKLINKAAVHTGAMATAVGGYFAGGAPGFAAGFILPELAANPTIQMKVARFLAGENGAKLTASEIGKLPPGIAIKILNEQKKRRSLAPASALVMQNGRER